MRNDLSRRSTLLPVYVYLGKTRIHICIQFPFHSPPFHFLFFSGPVLLSPIFSHGVKMSAENAV